MSIIGKLIHYPECWDTAGYPTLEVALHEIMSETECPTCRKPQGIELKSKDGE